MPAPKDRIDYGDTQCLPGLGPPLGSTWRNRKLGNIVTVVQISQRRHGWVTIRTISGEREILLADLERFYTPHDH